jgi:hypothetical protein
MALLNFPPNPTNGQIYSIGLNNWIWNGSAWIKYTSSTQSPIAVNTTTVSTGTNTGAVVISGGLGVGGSVNVGSTSTVNGAEILTTATITLQKVTHGGNTTTDPVFITNKTNSTSTTTGALVIAGGIGIGGRINAESVKIADSVLDSTLVLVNNTATTIIDTYSVDEYRAAKYLIQIDSGSGPAADFQVIEILLLVDNIQTIYATEYGLLTTNGELGEFAADVQNDNNVRLYFTPYQATDKAISVLRTGMVV